MRADARGALATTLNPAGLGLSRQLVFEGSYGYRPGDSASVVSASACDSTVPIPGCFYYHYLTADPTVEGAEFDRRVHDFGIAAARAITSRLLLGINARYFDYNSNLAGEEDASGFSGDAGAILRATETIHIAAVGYNLVARDSAQYPLGIGAGIMVRPVAPLALGLDAVWNLEVEDDRGTGRYGLGAEYFLQSADLQSGYPLRAGAVHDREFEGTYLTAGVGFVSPKVAIDLGARKQVAGGDELMIQGGLRLFGPTLP
jgi:hypothetical protein